MKKIILLLFIYAFIIQTATAQQGINYKAIINNAEGNPLANTAITVQFTILENGTTLVYSETHDAVTDANGILIVSIGEGTVLSGDFSTIQWGSAPHYLKTEIDKGEGLVDMGTTEFKTVPFALHASTAGNVTGFTPSTPNLGDVLTAGNEANSQIKNVSNPTENQDAATKAYVDALIDDLYNDFVEAGIGIMVKDIDDNAYEVIKIGNQVWLAENLKTTKYNDGTSIPQISDNAEWTNLTTPGYCWYNNDQTTYGDSFGALYNWYTVSIGNLCPAGWHVPTEDEWTTLTTYLGGEEVAGGKLKEIGTILWHWPNAGATNETGFSAVPGGYRLTDGGFEYIGVAAFWWSATEYNASNARYRAVYYGNYFVLGDNMGKRNGLSVRCLRD